MSAKVRALSVFIAQRLESIDVERHKYANVCRLFWRIITTLIKLFAKVKAEFNQERLEQEMVLFAHKIDVAEELDRLSAHLLEIKRVLAQDGAVGRKLDFLMQELNREANTLGSKRVEKFHSSLSSVELKVLIEQMREQIQNLE